MIVEENLIADIKDTHSFTTDTPDFGRREGLEFPRHGARSTGETAYFNHVINCSKKIMEMNKLIPKDFKYVVLHQPNGRFPAKAAKMLGFDQEQIRPGLLTPWIGNTYSGSTLLGLVRILDEANEGDLILATSYGSGAGSDSFIIEVTKENAKRKNTKPLQYFVDRKEYVDYAIYAKFKGKIKEVRLEK